MMIRLSVLAIVVLSSQSVLAQRVRLSRVFASEPQNSMAKEIPNRLLKAFASGDIDAYYPNNTRVPIPLAQFYQHFGERDKALATLTSGPDWYCGSTPPPVSDRLEECFSVKFEIGTVMTNGKPQPRFVRLVHYATCDPRAFDVMGPVFKLEDMMKLTGTDYRVTNPRNAAVTYSVSDILLLHLYADRVPLQSD